MNDKTVPSYVQLKHPITGEICLYPADFEQKHLNSALRYQAKPDDVFICSYPKCGTTWLQNIVWLVVHDGESMRGPIRHNMPMLEFDGCEIVEKINEGRRPRILKTHFRWSWVSQHPQAKYLYIARNPKDALVSYYYHCKGFVGHFDCEDLNFDKLFDLYVKDEVEFFGYFNHVTEWYAKRDEANVLFLLYEDLKADPKTQILKIAKFLGDQYYEAMLKDNEKILREVIEKSSFSAMKAVSSVLVRWRTAFAHSCNSNIQYFSVSRWEGDRKLCLLFAREK